MPAKYVQRGYGQVEPNRLSGITFGNIEAQAPAYEDAGAQTYRRARERHVPVRNS